MVGFLWLSRISVGLVGLYLVTFGLFAYPEEKQLLHERTEKLWSEVYDRSRYTDHVTTVFFNRVASRIVLGYDALFGVQLISFRAAAVSSCLSVAGLHCFFFFLEIARFVSAASVFWGTFQIKNLLEAAIQVPLALGCIALAVLPIFWRSRFATAAACAPFFIYFFWRGGESQAPSLNVLYGIGLPAAILSDYLVVILCRRIVKNMTKVATWNALAVTACKLISCILITFVVPAMVFSHVLFHHTDVPYYVLIMGALALVVLQLNFITAVIAALPLFVLAWTGIYRILLPVASRVLLPIAEDKIILNRKLIVGSGAALAGLALGSGTLILKLIGP
jgi:hypothetical protein